MPYHSLIAGCGSVGIALGRRLAEVGHTVWGVRRNAQLLPSEFITPIAGDLNQKDWVNQLPSRLDFVFYLASSDGRNERSYERAYVKGPLRLLEALRTRALHPKRFFFVSSTGVYAQQGGEWVDENSPTEPDHFAGRILLTGESVVLESAFPSSVVRFSGIYGPDRSRLLRRVADGDEACVRGCTLYTNRIHRDDCAGILFHLTSVESPKPVYLGVDHEPVDRCILVRWLAQQLGAPLPVEIEASKANSRRTRSNKRCSNQRIVGSGYHFIYPTFREGYAPLVRQMKGADS